MISLLLAMDANRLIGRENQLPWHLPKDLAYFKRMTMNHKIVMGRKTFDSIGRPLPGRENIILTRDKQFSRNDCLIIHSMDELLELSKQSDEEIFVIGGSEIFKEILPHSDRLYITHIYHEFEGDTYFPETDDEDWEVISREVGETDDKNPYHFEFVVYDRKNK